MAADRRQTSGFTLIEVLVALAVVGLALGAALSSTAGSIRNHTHVREQTLASWLAMDLRAELLLAEVKPAFLGPRPVTRMQWGQAFEAIAEPVAGPDTGPDAQADAAAGAPASASYRISVWPADNPDAVPVSLTLSRRRLE